MNDLVKKQSTELTKFDDSLFESVGEDQTLSKADIMIPKILIMQGQSPKVLEGDASFGELRDTLNWKIMGKVKTSKEEVMPLTCIPFHREKYWIIKKADGDKFKTETIVRVDYTNENLDMYETWVEGDGVVRKRVFLLLFYVLVEGNPIPYTVGFRGSSLDTGKALGTQMYVVNKSLNVKEAYKRSPMGKVIDLIPTKVSKNDNTYTVLEMRINRESTKEEAMKAYEWYMAVSSGETKAEATQVSKIDDEEVTPVSGEF